jgi:hypothetical protein
MSAKQQSADRINPLRWSNRCWNGTIYSKLSKLPRNLSVSVSGRVGSGSDRGHFSSYPA